MDSPSPETLEQLRAEIQRLHAHVTALEAHAQTTLQITGFTLDEPPLWFDAVSDAIIVTDASWRIQHWNQAAAQIYGWTQAAARGQLVAEIIPIVHYPAGESAESARRAIMTDRTWGAEVVQHTRDGREVVIDASVRVFTDDQGGVVGSITINRDITDRVRAEQALQANQQRLVLALEAAQIITWEWDIATGTITYSAHVTASFGIPQGGLAHTIDEMRAKIYPPDLPRFAQAIEDVLQRNTPTQLQIRLYTPDGKLCWVEIRGLMHYDAAGRPVRVIGVTRDISVEQQLQATAQAAQQTAAEALARLDAIFISAPTGIAYLDRELRYVLINPALAALNGRPPADHLGRTLAEVSRDPFTQLEPLMRRVFATGVAAHHLEVLDQPVPHAVIVHAWVINIYPIAGPEGAVVGVGMTVADITEHRRAEAALRETERKLGTLFALLPVGISILDAEQRLVYANPALEQVLRMDHAGLSHGAHRARQYIRPDGTPMPVEELARSRVFREQQAVFDVETGIITETGAAIWANVSAVPVDFPDWRVVMVTTDITARKQTEAALAAHAEALSRTNAELTRALRLKGEFLAMMSHELRTPLSVILGTCEALDTDLYGPISAAQRQALEIMTQSGQHLLGLLSDILDLARMESDQAAIDLQPIHVDHLCHAALQLVQAAAQQKGMRLMCSMEMGVDGLAADERWLTQILVNLLDNAIKFTPAGGTVGLEVAGDAGQEQIQFVVWDTGIGIAEVDLPRLFQPFTQVDGRLSRQYGGVGLGLTLVRRLVDLHGGSIRLESSPGQGSRFTVCLPWAAADNVAPCAAPDSPPLPSPWARPPRVVIADDYEPTLALYRDMLTRQGCHVAVARTGEEALVQVHVAHPDVVVLDIQMPGIKGWEAIQRLRADPTVAAVPIIALTALAMPGDRERCLAAGASAYLAKPVGLRALLAAITAVLPTATEKT